MKTKVRILYFTIFCFFIGVNLCLPGQTLPTQIDFEPNPNAYGTGLPYVQAELDQVSNAYFLGAYHVTFHLGTLGGIRPLIAEVGPGVTTCNNPNRLEAAFQNLLDGPDTPRPPGFQPNNEDFGQFFLTDDGCINSITPPNGSISNILYVDYDETQIQCREASGNLLDVDGEERWIINVYGVGAGILPIASVDICGPITQCNPQPPCQITGGEGIGSFWSFSNLSHDIDYIEFQYDNCGNPNKKVGLAFDNFNFCTSEPLGCCPSNQNLIPNGDFEAGNVGFQSEYTPLTTPGILNPNEYAVIPYFLADTICPFWKVEDHTFCATGNNNKILVVNGQTQQDTNLNNIIWQTGQPVPLDSGSQYTFCANFRNLPGCCFNIEPKVIIEARFEGGSWQNVAGPITITTNRTDPCDWYQVTRNYTAHRDSLEIRILLDERGNGDGNDLAIDDISVCEIQALNKMPGRTGKALSEKFNIFPNPASGIVQIEFDPGQRKKIEIQILDLMGQVVMDLGEDLYEKGVNQVSWNPDPALINGVYFVRLRTGEEMQLRKLILNR